jgi:hypothetical protein
MCGNNIHCDKTVNVAIDPSATKYCTWQYSLLHQNILHGNTSVLLKLNSMRIHPNAMYDYMAKKLLPRYELLQLLLIATFHYVAITMIIATNIKNHYKVLLQCYYLQPFLTKVTLFLLEGIATNMALLQPYFTVAIDQFSSNG